MKNTVQKYIFIFNLTILGLIIYNNLTIINGFAAILLLRDSINKYILTKRI
jgi:hypothetical protein